MSTMNSPSMPPTSSDFNMPAEPPAWPKVIGIISIVWGSLGVFCNACGLIGQAGGSFFLNMMPPAQQEQMKAQMAAGGVAQIAVYALASLLAAMLIVAGVLVLKRNILGRTLHLVYGVLAIILTIIGTLVALGGVQAQLAAMANDPNLPAAQAAGARMGVYIGLVIGVCIGIAYPAFCLIWFMMKRTHRDMTGGFSQDPIV
jgi:small-conductance mechanosensitive channel